MLCRRDTLRGMTDQHDPGTRLPPRLLVRPVRRVPFEGCALFSPEDVPEVPQGARLGVRLGVYDGTDEAWFSSGPFSLGIEPEAMVLRWGAPSPRVRYLAALWVLWDAGGVQGVLRQRVLDEIPPDASFPGDEPWPIDPSRASQAIRDEIARRAEARMQARAAREYQQAGSYAAPPTASGRGSENDEEPPPFPAAPGHSWRCWRGSWVQVPDPHAPAPAPASVSWLGQVVRFLATVGGLPAPLTSGPGLRQKAEAHRADVERERERLRLDHEAQQKAADRMHALLLAQLQA